jgi:hypothetical protein
MFDLALCFHKSVGGGFLFFIFTDDKKKTRLKIGPRARGRGPKEDDVSLGGRSNKERSDLTLPLGVWRAVAIISLIA